MYFYLSNDYILFFFFFSSRRRHTRYIGDWSSDVCSSDLALARADHGERSERGRAVRNEVEEHRPGAERGARCEADQQEAGLRDRRVRQHPLDVPLHERREVADRERRDGDTGERPRPEMLLARERRPQHPEGEEERSDLRRRR